MGDDKGKGDRIALIYATGNIVDGKGQEDNIGSEPYIELLRKARYDKAVKAIVLRVNSGGGSALASENIWREMALAKKGETCDCKHGGCGSIRRILHFSGCR